MKRVYVVIFEKAENNWAAYLPQVPGCITTGRTRKETERLAQEALEFHFEGLREDGDPIPEPAPVDFNTVYQKFPFDGIGYVAVDVKAEIAAA